MYKQAYKDFHKTLMSTMTESAFLDLIKLSKKEIIQYIDKSGLDNAEAVAQCFDADHLVICKKVASICNNAALEIAGIDKEQLLTYVYDWCRSIMFPCNFSVKTTKPLEQIRLFFLQLLRSFLKYERNHTDFVPTRHFELEDSNTTQHPSKKFSYQNDDRISLEYEIFLKSLSEQYVIEFMRIASEITPFDTLGHVAGVHFTAMHVAKQLSIIGKPVNLKLISAAALLHDIGKFGCRSEEVKRTPYLHYYYTDRYTKRYNMPEIGHIAANHSTWDLELEDLSIENLILIYADFRVKSTRDADGHETVHFYSLKDSFDIILNKLDNVDEAKKNRYCIVYARLKDFEDYMINLGINTDFKTDIPKAVTKPFYVLMHKNDIVKQIKYKAIDSNIYIMTQMNSETALRDILESARSEKNWRNIRAYINIFDEYFTYLSTRQTNLTLEFIYELLMNSDTDIRHQASVLMGKLIANYDHEYRKELPKDVTLAENTLTGADVLNKLITNILYPDSRITLQHRKWLGYSLRRIMQSIHNYCCEKRSHKFIDTLLKYYTDYEYDEINTFVMIDAASDLDYKKLTDTDISVILDFTVKCRHWTDKNILVNTIQLYRKMVSNNVRMSLLVPYISRILTVSADDMSVNLRFIRFMLGKESDSKLSLEPPSEYDMFNIRFDMPQDELLSSVFSDNLKVSTSGTDKKINIEILKYIIEISDGQTASRIATHLSNLLVVSRRLSVREKAGELLVDIIRSAPETQRNEMVIELAESLDSGDYQYIKYVPDYLGRMALCLDDYDLDELINDTFDKFVNGNNYHASIYTLYTIGNILKNYPAYFGEENIFSDKKHIERIYLLLGYLLRGLSHYNEAIDVESVYVIGRDILGSAKLSLKMRCFYFEYICKSLISEIDEQSDSSLTFFNRAASLNYIYRFISEYEFNYNSFDIKESRKVAFFPGTFDPFTNGHKGIVNAVKSAGFEVYLALDEFSWSKKTQPKLIRRKITQMSVSDIGNVYVFPDNIPVNIANPVDLKHLHELFIDRELYIVVGIDVIANASAYKIPPEEFSIHNFNHVVFTRAYNGQTSDMPSVDDIIKRNVFKDVIKLELRSELEDISSTRIRDNIDLNRDISNLIDPLAQKYIYENNLYLREPQYKEFEVEKKYTIIHEQNKFIVKDAVNAVELTSACFHEAKTYDLYNEFNDYSVIHYIREHAPSRLAVITDINIYMPEINEGLHKNKSTDDEPLQLMITEILAHCIQEGFTHIVCMYNHELMPDFKDILLRQGFVNIVPKRHDEYQYYIVDMQYPLVLIQNMATVIKEPFNNNPAVISVLNAAHKRLQNAMSELYPGKLVLSFNARQMNQRMLQMIADSNNVPEKPLVPRVLGKKMCVPFGKILRNVLVPNTVTKAIYTEKVYSSDASHSKIQEYPGYSPLKTQIKTLKSFNRPIILADDILHKGDRLKKLYPMLKKQDVTVDKLIVGILSGYGSDITSKHNIAVDSVYYVPNLKAWFQESTLYPFIGGDMIETAKKMRSGLLSSINQIMPYVIPQFLPDVAWNQFYTFSMICLENARNILKVLEDEYQNIFERNLTLSRLSEVIIEPYCTDQGDNLSYDINIKTSKYIENDILKMERLRNFID